MSKASDEAALRWVTLLPVADPDSPVAATILALASTAFAAYEQEWFTPPGFNVGDWRWPFAELESYHGDKFRGHQPWTVLLRHAWKLSRGEAEEY